LRKGTHHWHPVPAPKQSLMSEATGGSSRSRNARILRRETWKQRQTLSSGCIREHLRRARAMTHAGVGCDTLAGMATPLTYHAAGESHGPGLIILVQGMPAGARVDEDLINHELKRRQGGYGRGARQKIETDVVEVLTGVRRGKTIGSPIAMRIAN